MAIFAWATDIHLDSLRNDEQVIEFGRSLVKDSPSGVLLTGDLSNGKSIVHHLALLEKAIARPVYFVLGNHDFYESSVQDIRKAMHELTNVSEFLKYLPTLPYVPLTQKTALVGHDGWYDGMNGDYKRSRFIMNDWYLIKEFAERNCVVRDVSGWSISPNYTVYHEKVVEQAKLLAKQAVDHVHAGIKAAVRYHKNIVVMTHFPPFENAHIYNGKIGDAGAQPWYTSKMMGTLLLDAARTYSDVRFEVFCGHTHGKCDVKIAQNLFCHVGGAQYTAPELQSLVDLP
jgi:predicted phosphohydrolase